MSTYIPGVGLSSVTAENSMLVELRVLSNLIQQYNGGAPSQEDLRLMRNDEAFGLGIVPPIVPGQ